VPDALDVNVADGVPLKLEDPEVLRVPERDAVSD
jgi:hypothetical protein